MEQHTWKIQLEGLLKLIAGPLYKDPEVFVRELVQNAHDSIRKRLHAEGRQTAPEIRWIADPQAGTLTIRDNGAGLTREEIHLYLATVGRSGAGELKEALHSTDFIGQHGIGFLSAFAVADRV
jgi:molecular chaperone HtpG